MEGQGQSQVGGPTERWRVTCRVMNTLGSWIMLILLLASTAHGAPVRQRFTLSGAT